MTASPTGRDSKKSPPDGMWWLYPAAFLMVALLWVWFFAFETPHWVSVGMGAFTGMMFAFWIVEVTGNKFLGSPPDDTSSDSGRDL